MLNCPWVFHQSAESFSTLAKALGFSAEPRHFPLAYSDELSEAHRAKAVEIAYWAALTGGLLLFMLGLYQPMWAVVGLPLILVHSISSFGMLRFAILARRRDRVR